MVKRFWTARSDQMHICCTTWCIRESRRVSLMIIANNDDDDDRGYDFSHAVGFDEKVTKLAHQLTPSKLAATAVGYNSTFTHVFSLSLQIRLMSAQ